jgi:hypothetical protein
VLDRAPAPLYGLGDYRTHIVQVGHQPDRISHRAGHEGEPHLAFDAEPFG